MKRGREIMAKTTLSQWTIGAALALIATALAAEPMGEATRYVGNVGGRERTFIEYVPKTLKPGAPLLFVLHPSGGDAAGMRQYSNNEFDELADKHGFLVVYPDGFDNTWNDCRGGSPFSSKRLKIDDAGFIKSLLDLAVTTHAIDRKRVFAAGWSNGAQLAYRMALEYPEDFAGVAAISASVPVKENLDCGQVDKPIPVMIVNGTADPINPFRGGMVNLGGTNLGNVLSSEDTAKYWAEAVGRAGRTADCNAAAQRRADLGRQHDLGERRHPRGHFVFGAGRRARHAARRRGFGFARRDLGFLLQIAEPLTSRDSAVPIWLRGLKLHQRESRSPVRTIGIAERFNHFEMIVVRRLDQFHRLADGFQCGGEVAILSLEFRRLVAP